MHPVGAPARDETLGEELRTLGLVIDIANECVLDRHAPSGRLEVLPRRIKNVVDVETLIDGNELVAKLIVGRVERHGERHGNLLLDELSHGRSKPHGRHGDVPRSHPKPLGRGGVEPLARRCDGTVVRERLPHAHKNDVRDAAFTTGDLTTRKQKVCDAHLFEDLRCRKVPREAHLAGRTKRAVHTATGLGGNAQRYAIRIAHEDRLDERAVEQAPQELLGHALICALLRDLCEERWEEPLDEG